MALVVLKGTDLDGAKSLSDAELDGILGSLEKELKAVKADSGRAAHVDVNVARARDRLRHTEAAKSYLKALRHLRFSSNIIAEVAHNPEKGGVVEVHLRPRSIGPLTLWKRHLSRAIDLASKFSSVNTAVTLHRLKVGETPRRMPGEFSQSGPPRYAITKEWLGARVSFRRH